MNDDIRQDDFADRIAQPLRARERGDETFTPRVMHAIQVAREGARPRGLRWWLQPRTYRIPPAGFLALAAGLALFAAGLNRLAAPSDGRMPVAASADTVHFVRFVFVDTSARAVTLVGSFNGWTRDAVSLAPEATPGVWSVSVPLSSGRHEYAFIVRDGRGERWLADPFTTPVRDDFGTESSILFLGT